METDAKQLVNAQGESLTVEQAVANLQQREDTGLRYYAAWWLGRFRVTQTDAVDALIQALEDESDRAPDGGYPLRRNAARALGKLGQSRAVAPLIQCLDCDDYYVRESAAQALGALGDGQAIPALLNLLAGGVDAAVSVEGKPHLVQPYNAILEALGCLGAQSAVEDIRPFLSHPVAQVQNAAARAMYQLTGDDSYGQRLVERLQEPNLQLRRSAMMDLGAMGYLPAAEPIAATLAENSLKLIALQGVLEAHLQEVRFPDADLTPEAQRVLALMDDLL
ncbi:HEAT repeat domain-containing protein [Phormidium sp. FACHB-1136]|uniref:HEAT repeat domain-containing protein n=1 Tax=Phormidium sp. FACHB-1136 TaxID=2692848 RepID=UPI001684F467|nr:HEAT repeat domain-containing protein [Phormidium sp. FACHB-1136]MBD2424614.1 HEAT repeat domain-containing protein [Phormidium sp. FACHB-1136]